MTEVDYFDEAWTRCINLSFRNLPSSESRRRLEKDSQIQLTLPSNILSTSTTPPSQHVPHYHPQIIAHRQTAPRHHQRRRDLPRVQIEPLPQPVPPLPRQPGMLPQDVRVLRGPPLLPRPRPLPHQRLWQNTTQTPLPDTDLRRYSSRTRSGY